MGSLSELMDDPRTCTYKTTHISTVINSRLSILVFKKKLRLCCFNGTKFATLGQLTAKICESFCRYTFLVFLYFSIISHVFINIHEK